MAHTECLLLCTNKHSSFGEMGMRLDNLAMFTSAADSVCFDIQERDTT